jgi:hypothetical protein
MEISVPEVVEIFKEIQEQPETLLYDPHLTTQPKGAKFTSYDDP